MLGRKLNAFRKGNVKCTEYNVENHTISLKGGWLWRANLAFSLTDYAGKLQLAFSGDAITRDGEALARVMKAMWSYELPEFPESDALRLQLWDDSAITDKRTIYFRDMASRVAGMPNEVRVTTVTSYLVDNR